MTVSAPQTLPAAPRDALGRDDACADVIDADYIVLDGPAADGAKPSSFGTVPPPPPPPSAAPLPRCAEEDQALRPSAASILPCLRRRGTAEGSGGGVATIVGTNNLLPAATGMEALQPARRERVPLFSRRAGEAFWVAGALLAALAFWVAGGHALLLPAHPLAVKGSLALATLDSAVDDVGGRAVLRVEAELRNGGARPEALPPLLIRVTTEAGTALCYPLPGAPDRLGPGERRRFSSSLPVPPGGIRSAAADFD